MNAVRLGMTFVEPVTALGMGLSEAPRGCLAVRDRLDCGPPAPGLVPAEQRSLSSQPPCQKNQVTRFLDWQLPGAVRSWLDGF